MLCQESKFITENKKKPISGVLTGSGQGFHTGNTLSLETSRNRALKTRLFIDHVCLHLGLGDKLSDFCCSCDPAARHTHHGIQQRERRQVEEGLSRLVPHRVIHMVELIYDVVT